MAGGWAGERQEAYPTLPPCRRRGKEPFMSGAKGASRSARGSGFRAARGGGAAMSYNAGIMRHERKIFFLPSASAS